MLDALQALSVIYFLLFIAGVGIYLALVPQVFRAPELVLCLIPNLGLLLITICSAFCLFLNLTVHPSYMAAVAISSFLTVVWAFRFPACRFSEFQFLKSGIVKISFRSLLVLGIFFAMISPGTRGDFASTPYRIGIDQSGYAETAQFLLENGTLPMAQAKIIKQTRAENLTEAKKHNNRSVNFNAYVDSEFLLKALRWGYPAVVATLSRLTNADHVYRILFVLLAFPCALIFAIAAQFFQEFFSVSKGLALLFAAGLALNCNFLNVYYEGQYAQVFGTPFLMTLFYILFWLRKRNYGLGETSVENRREDYPGVMGYLVFVVAGMMVSYNEIIFTFSVFCGLVAFADLALNRTIRWKSWQVVTIGVVAGMVLVAPFTWRWIHFLLPHLKNIRIGGFWQPKWASPMEILGLKDIYKTTMLTSYLLTKRVPGEMFKIALVSLGILGVVLAYIRRKEIDRAFWLAGPVFVLAIFFKNYRIEHIHNYQYFKAYTMVLFPIVALTLVSFHGMFWKPGVITKGLKLVVVAIPIFMVVKGLLYIRQFIDESGYVDRDMLQVREWNRTLDLGRYVILTNQGKVREFMLMPIFSMNWFNQGTETKIPTPHLDDPVAIVFFKKDLICPSCVSQLHPGQVLAENNGILIVDTKRKLRDGLIPGSNTVGKWEVFLSPYRSVSQFNRSASMFGSMTESEGKRARKDGATFRKEKNRIDPA